MDSTLDIIAALVFVLIAIGGVIVVHFQQQRLDDPQDTSVVYPEQIADVSCISEGPVCAILLRQSGNVYRDLGDFDDVNSAACAVASSLNRAGIDAVKVTKNTPNAMAVYRLQHNHRGSQEGKKMGGAVIERI